MLNLSQVLEATGGRLVGAASGSAFTRVAVDSRTVVPGALFVALRGERVDGHAFVSQALAAGAPGAIVEHVPSDIVDTGGVLVVVESSAAALAAMARYRLAQQPTLEVVGITGSLGKTTTKEVTSSVLGSKKRGLKS